MIIKIIPQEDFDQMITVVQGAYAGSFTGTKDESERMKTIFIDMTENDSILPLGAYDGDVLMGSVFHYTFDTNFHGEMIKTAGIGMLAVDLLHKKKGVAKQLILDSFKRSQNASIELYHLYPFSTEFYKNFGFGYGVPVYTYCVAPKDFVSIGNKNILSYATAEDYEAMFNLYDTKVRNTHGMSLKSYSDKKRLDRFKSGRILIAKEDDEIIGYLIMGQKGLLPENNQSQKIIVNEMIYNKREALLAFADFFNGQKDQVDYVEIATFDAHFHQILKNTSFVPKPQTLEIISLKAADLGLGLMPLVLEPQKLFDRIKERCTDSLEFKITTPKGDVMYARTKKDNDLHIDLSINAFSSWITGVITLESLYQTGQLDTDQPQALKGIDRAFYLDRPQSYTKY